MATFTKFQPFVEACAEKKHNLGSDQLKLALCAAANAPLATYSQLSELTEIAYTNLSTRNMTTSSSSQTNGTYKLVLADNTLTASGGDVAPFRYVVLYNDTATNKDLIGYWDYTQDVTIHNGESLLVDCDPTNGVLQVA